MLINVSFLPATLIHWFEKLIYQNRHYSYHPGKKLVNITMHLMINVSFMTFINIVIYTLNATGILKINFFSLLFFFFFIQQYIFSF